MERLKLEGQTFGRFTVLSFVGKQKNGASLFLCLCSCGVEKVVLGQNLKGGCIVSCGCWRRERGVFLSDHIKTHGLCGTKIHRVWNGMKNRCFNPNDSYYHRYGGRGITVCKRWMKLENFYEDMSDPPKGKTIDRIDNDGDYCKENCRWATPKQQSRNTSVNIKVMWEGKFRLFIELCEELGINLRTAISRYKKGFPLEEVFSKEKFGSWHRSTSHDDLLTHNGRTQRMTYWLQEWTKETGFKPGTLWARIKRGWSVEKTLSTPILANRPH